ncbi:tRNA (adenine(22)-N(1))-methyltransferase [Viridibacillus arvi]|uniref:tRNA (adenine(22)-N(1))-methyltransferase n=1 Tax=Viridibacillus arvi TaxID=263475 RepID=UPI00187B1D48|nr:tRNA (adenine(22)-N(1))-methyltransferase TrmK [Viridibacillus sp. JNUCC-6]QOV12721.1 tRNA (adenine-N(1))-methyltransferase [Viridibacillus sp. JNUCC-6]
MNAQKLSKRLETVAKFVPQDAIVADIGSDHAYLPCYLVHNNIAKSAIAGEVVKGPYDSACHEVQKEQLTNKITVRLADGLAAIEPGDGVTAITIAGMGGPLITSILEKHPLALEGVERLILQPNIHAKVIREWALQNSWKIIDEVILLEDEKTYEILVLERGEMNLSELEKLLGPVLKQQHSDVFHSKWTREVEQWGHVREALQKAEQTPEILAKSAELAHLIEAVGEVLKR